MSLAGFNPMDIEPAEDFAPIPEGEYEVMITGTEWRDNSKGTGRYLSLSLQVIEGPYENRLLWEMLNLDNPNEQAVAISMKALSAICRAVGHTKTLDTDDGAELCNRPMRVKIGIDPAKGQYKAKNRVRAWLPKLPGSRSSVDPGPAAQADAPAKRTPPWAK
jgi:hypothetical protein